MRYTFGIFIVLLLSFLASAAKAAPTAVLGLDAFLDQVKSGHAGVKGARLSSEGAELRSHEADLVFAPTLDGRATFADDKKVQYFFPITETVNNVYSLGVSKQFGFGLRARVGYDMNYFHYAGRTPFHEGHPVLELTQPLWRNWLGSEARAQQQQIEAGALAAHYAQSFQYKGTLVEAEVAYWRLALARENVDVQKEALGRSQKIYEWNLKRAKMNLADAADRYQAEAGLEVRRLNLEAAQNELRSAALTFNQARGVASEQVSEKLVDLDADMIEQLKIPDRAEMRDDVKAAEQQERAQVASAEIGRQRNAPTLDLVGQYALNSRDADLSPAISDSFKQDQPTKAIGVRFSAPLDLGALSDSREGYSRERQGAELQYQRRVFDSEREWSDLVKRLDEAKRRYALARKIEVVQRDKLGHERERLTRGRTTTYQVLQFEVDYSLSQLSRIQAQAEVLTLVARMKLFGGSSS